MKEPDVLVFHARLVSPPDGAVAFGAEIPLKVVEDGAVVGRGGVITDLGPTQEVLARTTLGSATRVVDADGRVLVPGLVDPHTHLLYGGERMDEMEMRQRGRSYMEILKAGGGILKSMADLRETSSEALLRSLLRRLTRVVLSGTVAIEVKSGYGLALKEEIRSLEIIRRAAQRTGLPIRATLLGAHAFPPGVEREAYLDELDRMTDVAARRALADDADVFCEEGVFTPDETRRILGRAREAGLGLRLHADELAPSGGAEVAAELGARSADHLMCASDEGLLAMARSGVAAVLLPGTSFFLGKAAFPAERARQAGLVVALATDSNPGSSPIESMAFILALAFHEARFTPAEALTAGTVNAASVLGLADRLGSLAIGKDMSVLILDDDDFRTLFYHPGSPLTWAVFERGRRLVERGMPTEEVEGWKSEAS